MPPFEHEPSSAPEQSGQSTASSIHYKMPEFSNAEKKNWGPATAATGRMSGSSTICKQSGPRIGPPNQHDSSKADSKPGSWRRRLSQSGLLTATGQPGSLKAHQPEGQAQSDLSTPPAEKEEAYRSWWSDDGPNTQDKGR